MNGREKTKRPAQPGTVSMQRALSKLGYCSRTESARLIVTGRVSLNGRTETNFRRRIRLSADTIAVDGRVLREKKEFLYICLNKPKGVVTTRSDERGERTVYDLLGKQTSWIFPVGRLDKESTGLLLLTNDTQFGEELTNPDSRHTKKYRVTVDRPLGESDRLRLERGITLAGRYTTRPCTVRFEKKTGNRSSFIITLTEGKNRQIRRMCEALGYSVVTLHRIGIGMFSIGALKSGCWRPLSPAEKKLILATE